MPADKGCFGIELAKAVTYMHAGAKLGHSAPCEGCAAAE